MCHVVHAYSHFEPCCHPIEHFVATRCLTQEASSLQLVCDVSQRRLSDSEIKFMCLLVSIRVRVHRAISPPSFCSLDDSSLLLQRHGLLSLLHSTNQRRDRIRCELKYSSVELVTRALAEEHTQSQHLAHH